MALRISVLALISVLVLGGMFVFLRPDSDETAPEKRSFDVEVRNGKMEPELVSAHEGDRVKLKVTSDSPVEMHVHGYDLEKEIEPDGAVEITFRADLTGRFPIEDHDTEAGLGFLVVRPRP